MTGNERNERNERVFCWRKQLFLLGIAIVIVNSIVLFEFLSVLGRLYGLFCKKKNSLFIYYVCMYKNIQRQT